MVNDNKFWQQLTGEQSSDCQVIPRLSMCTLVEQLMNLLSYAMVFLLPPPMKTPTWQLMNVLLCINQPLIWNYFKEEMEMIDTNCVHYFGLHTKPGHPSRLPGPTWLPSVASLCCKYFWRWSIGWYFPWKSSSSRYKMHRCLMSHSRGSPSWSHQRYSQLL